jgi:hypothetical protein
MSKRLLLLQLLFLSLLAACSATSPERAESSAKSQPPPRLSRNMQTSAQSMALPAMLAALQQKANHSWLQQLRADPLQKQHAPNRTSRQVT